MKRKYIYYFLTFIMGMTLVSARLNMQFVVVNELAPAAALLPWELVLLGFGSMLYAVSSLTLAGISDKLGRLPCIAGAGFVMLAMFAVPGWQLLGPVQIWTFFLIWGIASLSFAVFFTGIEGLLSEYQDHKMPLARRLGLYCISWSSGGAVGAYITGYAKETFGYVTVFRILTAICLGIVMIVILDFKFHGVQMFGDDEVGEADIRDDSPFYAKMARVGLFWGSLCFAALAASFPRFARDFHGLGEGQIGSLISTITFTCFITFAWFPFWKKWHYDGKLQVFLQGLMPVGLALLALAPEGNVILLRIALVLFGMGYAFCYFFSIYYSLLVPEGHSKSGGVHEGFLGMGKLAGPFLALGFIHMAGIMTILSEARLGAAAIVMAALAALVSLAIQGRMVWLKNRSN